MSKYPKPDLNQIISGQPKNAAAIYELVETIKQQNDWLEVVNRKLEGEEEKFGALNSN